MKLTNRNNIQQAVEEQTLKCANLDEMLDAYTSLQEEAIEIEKFRSTIENENQEILNQQLVERVANYKKKKEELEKRWDPIN